MLKILNRVKTKVWIEMVWQHVSDVNSVLKKHIAGAFHLLWQPLMPIKISSPVNWVWKSKNFPENTGGLDFLKWMKKEVLCKKKKDVLSKGTYIHVPFIFKINHKKWVGLCTEVVKLQTSMYTFIDCTIIPHTPKTTIIPFSSLFPFISPASLLRILRLKWDLKCTEGLPWT